MTAWLSGVPALGVALGLLVLLGLPASIFLPVRGVERLASAIVVSLASISGAALISPLLGVTWSLLPVIGLALIIAVIAAALRIFARNRDEMRASGLGRSGWISLTIAFLGWLGILMFGIGSPEHPSQLYDAVFHLNAVEFILSTGDASPLHMTMTVPGREVSFYPTLWHALVSLVVLVAAVPVTVATNVVTLTVVALIWPVALVVLTRQLFPAAKVAAALAPILGFCFAIFPLGFLNWGVLYPNLLGMALVPILLAFALASAEKNMSAPVRVARLLLAVASVGVVALGHPSSLLAAVALLVPWGFSVVIHLWRTHPVRRTRVVIGVGTALGLGTLAIVWRGANVTTKEWLPWATLAQAVGEIAFLSPVGRSTGLLLGVLAAIGMVSLVRSRLWWPVAAHLVAAFFFAMATWFTILSIRSLFVGVWYDDTTRVGALLAVFGIPLAAYGAQQVWDWAATWNAHGREPRFIPGLVAVLVVLFGATHLLAIKNDLRMMRNTSFAFTEASQGLSPDEELIFDEAFDVVDDDGVVIGDPLTGAALYFAYTGGEVVYFHIGGTYGADAALLAKNMREGGTEVCAAIGALGVTHAFDFGDRSMYPKADERYAGLHNLEEADFLSEVARSGDAVLYEVTGCQ